MSTFLLVPIHIDALIPEGDGGTIARVRDAMTDYTRLPYLVQGVRTFDNNDNLPHVSDRKNGRSVLSPPLANPNLELKPGVYLHWSLPDALTKGVQGGDGMTTFPQVPNRWLVTRSRDDQIEKQWIVESDYLYPADKQMYDSVTIAYPTEASKNGSEQPFRYLGRQMELNEYVSQAGTSQAEYLSELTAIGPVAQTFIADHTQATFAAFYPSCRSVFGFQDTEFHGHVPPGTVYDVIGWYASAGEPVPPEQDCLVDFLNQHPDFVNQTASQPLSAHHNALQNAFGWSLPSGAVAPSPWYTLCYAQLTFPDGATPHPTTHNVSDAGLAIGNTGTEALSAYLAQAIDPANKDRVEEQLEALHLADRLEQRQLDLGAKFKEARHEKGFKALAGGKLWRLVPAHADNADTQVTLPDELAHQLNLLNQKQAEYDQALYQIASRREQLFAAWYAYMLCIHPGNDPDVYPQPNAFSNILLYYIQHFVLSPLLQAIENTGSLNLTAQGQSGHVTHAAAEGSGTDMLATKLAQAITDVLAGLPSGYALRFVPAPRYWQPNDPVVLITGEMTQATDRHGQDGRLSADGFLTCHFVHDIDAQSFFQALGDPMVYAHLWHVVRNTTAGLDPQGIGFRHWTTPAWNPLMLEWKVELYPNPIDHADRSTFPPTYVTDNYVLADNASDFAVHEGREDHVVTDGSTQEPLYEYSGFSILTPHASMQLKKKIEAYLVMQFCDANQHPLPSDVAAYFDKQSTAIVSWANGQNAPVISTVVQAYNHLQDLPCLSQALGGFNDALLTYARTMQLEVEDPIAVFNDAKQFVAEVHSAVHDPTGHSLPRGPMPSNPFHPVRSGVMRFLTLQLVDTFGQVGTVLDIDQNAEANNRVVTTELMASKTDIAPIWMSPRLVQPARLNVRWLSAKRYDQGLSAKQDDQEMNSHPAATPICGWLLPNNLDRSLMVYNTEGEAQGSLDVQANWRPAPGSNTPLGVDQIDNAHLQNIVRRLIMQGPEFVSAFISALDNALETIDPENFAHHEGLALLMGRPIAVVRASVNLELQGLPAISQNATDFQADLSERPNADGTWTRTTAGFTGVNFPIRIGEYQQLNDGLVGYWLEQNGDLSDTFYAPQSQHVPHDLIHTHADGVVNIEQSVDAAPHVLTMLLDPRCQVHFTSGILPTKAIEIPPDQFAKALQTIEITFLSTPVLTNRDAITLPLPKEPGYAWSWLAEEDGVWSETKTIAPIQRNATFSGQQQIREGWLKLRPQPVPEDPA